MNFVQLEDITSNFMNGNSTNLFFFRSSSSRLADKKKGRKSIFLSPAASRLEQICLILFKAPISEPCVTALLP